MQIIKIELYNKVVKRDTSNNFQNLDIPQKFVFINQYGQKHLARFIEFSWKSMCISEANDQ